MTVVLHDILNAIIVNIYFGTFLGVIYGEKHTDAIWCHGCSVRESEMISSHITGINCPDKRDFIQGNFFNDNRILHHFKMV